MQENTSTSPRFERISISRLGSGVDGVGYLNNGKTVFVPFSCPGDELEIKIVSDGEKFARGEIVEIIKAGPDRVAPPCPYFMDCGGCDLQHVSYEAQLTAKRNTVVENLRRIAKLNFAHKLVDECLASKHEYGYRNKIEMAARMGDRGLELGFHRRRSREIIPIDSCMLLPRKFENSPKAIRGALRFALGSQKFDLERVGIRVATYSNDAEISLYTPPGAFPRAMVAKTLNDSVRGLSGITRVLVKDELASRRVSGVEVLSGKGFVSEMLSGFSYAISAPSFWQVNTRMAQKLVDKALEYLAPDGSDSILDLYSGVGTFSLPIAKHARKTYAVESYGPAVSDLQRNLEYNDLFVEVVGGDASKETNTLRKVNKVLVDPPRSGLSARVVKSLNDEKRVKTLVYVSCDSATLARDIARLASGGWELKRATPIDLFPQTSHIETVALLER